MQADPNRVNTPHLPSIAAPLLAWYDRAGRKDLPWQRDPTPYRVWVSEIMLQQTQVSVVIPYFERFVARFPTLPDLAAASQDEVLAFWSGLGYYARARNLHRAAVLAVERHGGALPDSLESLQALPGIGRSTAGAILSLALGQRQPILDGNVKRVLARRFGVAGWPGRSQILGALWRLAELETPVERVDHYNQAMMDLGATLCTRAAPACPRCPLAGKCVARIEGRQSELPSPRPAKTIPERRTLLLLARTEAGEVLLQRRAPAGIWGGLWSLPELDVGADPADWCRSRLGASPHSVEMLPPRRHTFTHFRLGMEIAEVGIEPASRAVAEDLDHQWIPPAQIAGLGLPAPIRRLIDETVGKSVGPRPEDAAPAGTL
jgi:A/G-specific adenine glycosylase